MSNVVVLPAHSQAEIELIKATVAKGASDIELKLFLERCARMGLDPLKPGQIHFVKYGTGPGTIIIGREGFRSRAGQTGKHSGTKLGVMRDANGNCIGAWCEVYRTDWTHPAREEVSLSEYNTQKNQWAKMPETMIKKVAECAALRMAFPDELGGVYSKEEMEQAAEEPIREVAPTKPGDYIVKIGTKFRGMKLSDIQTFEISGFMKWIKNEAKPDYQQRDDVKEFLFFADLFLRERSIPEEEFTFEDTAYEIAKAVK